MIPDKQEQCPNCKCERTFEFSSFCGAWLCEICDYHLGLVRCYCGWSASGRDGRRELEEFGEQIEDDY